MEKKELRPCPFCGRQPGIFRTICESNNFVSFKVQCVEFVCEVNPSTRICVSEAEAANAWNKRKRTGKAK
jgi:hypothetical protein